MKNSILLLLVLSNVYASVNAPLIVYGKDDRHETISTDPIIQKLAKSTAGMFNKDSVNDIGTHIMFNPITLGVEKDLIKGSDFEDQSSALSCSAFLVADDLMVTAGHCILNQDECDNSSFVFDYKIKELGKNADILVSKTKIYDCKEVVEAKLESDKFDLKNIDYSLVRLKRKVVGRTPLKFRTSGKINSSASVMTIGHPSGLPQKVTFNGQIFENDHSNYFLTNLDTFSGNSGSPVFNQSTGLVEGILVRGAEDYKSFFGMTMVNYVLEDIKGVKGLGESVSRITDIKYLKSL